MRHSLTCRQASATKGEPGQFVASPQPWRPNSVSILSKVQLYSMPSTRQVPQEVIIIAR